MKHLYLITGSCPTTHAEMRLAMAEMEDASGNHLKAEEWRFIVKRMRRMWADRSATGHARRTLGNEVVGPDPDALLEPLASSEHPMFWHQSYQDKTRVCPCGHFSSLLCDAPLGKGSTCDMPLCRCCTTTVADNMDQCHYHSALTASAPTDTPLVITGLLGVDGQWQYGTNEEEI